MQIPTLTYTAVYSSPYYHGDSLQYQRLLVQRKVSLRHFVLASSWVITTNLITLFALSCRKSLAQGSEGRREALHPFNTRFCGVTDVPACDAATGETN